MADDIKINPNVPIALFPGNVMPEYVAALNVDGSVGKAVLALTQSAYGQFYTALGEIVDTAKVVHAAELERNKAAVQMYERTKVLQAGMYFDTATNKVAVHLPVQTAELLNSTIADHFARAAPALDQALTEIRTAKAKCESDMAASIRDPSANNVEGIGLARETRDYVRSLPAHEAAAFVRDAIKAGDTSIVGAVLNVRHFLSGLPAATHAALKNEAMETSHRWRRSRPRHLPGSKATRSRADVMRWPCSKRTPPRYSPCKPPQWPL